MSSWWLKVINIDHIFRILEPELGSSSALGSCWYEDIAKKIKVKVFILMQFHSNQAASWENKNGWTLANTKARKQFKINLLLLVIIITTLPCTDSLLCDFLFSLHLCYFKFPSESKSIFDSFFHSVIYMILHKV